MHSTCSSAVCFCIYMPVIDRSLSDCRYNSMATNLKIVVGDGNVGAVGI